MEVLQSIDPWGQDREDLRIAKMVADVANMLGVTRNGRSMNALDYVLSFKTTPEPPLNPKALADRWLTYAKVHNAALARQRTQAKNLKRLGA